MSIFYEILKWIGPVLISILTGIGLYFLNPKIGKLLINKKIKKLTKLVKKYYKKAKTLNESDLIHLKLDRNKESIFAIGTLCISTLFLILTAILASSVIPNDPLLIIFNFIVSLFLYTGSIKYFNKSNKIDKLIKFTKYYIENKEEIDEKIKLLNIEL